MTETTKVPVKITPKAARLFPSAGGPAAFDDLRREMEQVFDAFRRGTMGLPVGLPFGGRALDFEAPWQRLADLTPAFDVAEREQNFEITAELPGMDEKDIEVKVANGNLTIRGEKKDMREEKEAEYHLCERRYGSFTRAFRLPDGVDPARIEARFAKGVLTVTLPKSAEAQKQEKKIEIKAA